MTVSQAARYDVITCDEYVFYPGQTFRSLSLSLSLSLYLFLCYSLFACSHIVVVIGFDQIVYNVIEEDLFVDIAFRINNYVTISSSSDPVEVQLQILEGSATG